MHGKFGQQPSRTTGPLLASLLTALLGAFGILAVIAGAGADPRVSALVFAASLVGILCLGLFVRFLGREIGGTAYDWVRSRNAKPVNEYSPEYRKRRKATGDHKPPTVEEIRDLKDNLRNWVPSPESKRRK